MNFKTSVSYFIRNLREKHRLSIRNQHNDSEVWYMYISPLNLLAGFLALVLILFIVITITVAYTPVLDLIPGYPGQQVADDADRKHHPARLVGTRSAQHADIQR